MLIADPDLLQTLTDASPDQGASDASADMILAYAKKLHSDIEYQKTLLMKDLELKYRFLERKRWRAQQEFDVLSSKLVDDSDMVHESLLKRKCRELNDMSREIILIDNLLSHYGHKLRKESTNIENQLQITKEDDDDLLRSLTYEPDPSSDSPTDSLEYSQQMTPTQNTQTWPRKGKANSKSDIDASIESQDAWKSGKIYEKNPSTTSKRDRIPFYPSRKSSRHSDHEPSNPPSRNNSVKSEKFDLSDAQYARKGSSEIVRHSSDTSNFYSGQRGSAGHALSGFATTPRKPRQQLIHFNQEETASPSPAMTHRGKVFGLRKRFHLEGKDVTGGTSGGVDGVQYNDNTEEAVIVRNRINVGSPRPVMYEELSQRLDRHNLLLNSTGSEGSSNNSTPIQSPMANKKPPRSVGLVANHITR